MKKATSEVRIAMAAWIKAASEHSTAVESHHEDLSEAEIHHASELADEAEGLAERARMLGADGAKLAQAFGLLRKSWLDTGLPPIAIQRSCAVAAQIA